MTQRIKRLSRRKALGLLGAAGASALAGTEAVAAAGGAPQGEAHLLELGRQSEPPAHLARQRRHVQQVAELHRGRGRRHHGGDGVAQEAGRRLRGRRRARRDHDGAVLGAGLFRERHPRADRALVQQVGREVGLLPQRGRAGALQAWPAGALPAADQHSVLPVLSRRLAEGGRRHAARDLSTSSSPPPRRSPGRRTATASRCAGRPIRRSR